MTYFAYLDEFGHIGPYISRTDPRYKESPVFGLAGFVLPASEVRGFGTWFFQRKCELLRFEIDRSGEHPAVWEKKGASLFTVTNVTRYRELRNCTNRLFNKIENLGGFVFYVGLRKTAAPATHDPNRLYRSVLVEAIKRIDAFCEHDRPRRDNFVAILDQHDQRAALITTFPLEGLTAETSAEPTAVPEDRDTAGTPAPREPQTIADVMDWARKRIATLSGVRMDAVKLDCRIET